jgi:hypothetical protein
MTPDSEPILSVEQPVSQEPHLSFGAKFWNLFVDPRKTFASITPNHEWVILWLLVGAISIGAYLPIKGIVKQSQIARVEEQLKSNQQIPEEKRAEILEGMESQFENPVYLLFVPATQLVVIVVVAGILLFLGNIILGGNTGYLKMLNAYAWTMLIVIPGSLVTVPMVLAKGSMDVSLGLGILTSAETGPFLKKLVSSFELFALWQVWLSSTAVSVLSKVSAKKAFGAVFVAWLIWVIVQGGLATLGVQFGA